MGGVGILQDRDRAASSDIDRLQKHAFRGMVLRIGQTRRAS